MTMHDLLGKSDGKDEVLADIARFRFALEARLDSHVTGGPMHLMAAARDGVLSPGKRMRPVMVHLVCQGRGVTESAVLDAGAAVEMVHAASLILDDLPCMDDAALRRARPATHAAFGEATAILAAVGLLNQAFGLAAALPAASDAQRVAAVAALSRAVGWQGLVAGQEFDLNGFVPADRAGSLPERARHINRLKTCHLLVAAIDLGAILSDLDARQTATLHRFAETLGQAFQIADDLRDHLMTAEVIGKDVGQDAGKPTLLDDLGLERTLALCLDLLHEADGALVESGLPVLPFRCLMDDLFERELLGARTWRTASPARQAS